MKIIDITLPLDNKCMNCGTAWHEKVKIERIGTIDKVGRNTSRIVLGSHSGTHIDAPLHFFDNTDDISSLPLEKVCGNISIVDLSFLKIGDKVTLPLIQNIRVTERMLFRFLWYKKWKTDEYYSDFPYFETEVINFLIKNGMKVIAMDTPSPDSFKNILLKEDSPNHKVLLKNNVSIIEYLTNTEKLDPLKENILIALPLKITGADGAPSRVIIVENNNGRRVY